MGLRALGRSHEKYGVEPAHYPIVKEVMLATMTQQLQGAFTERMADAWSQALDLVTSAMKDWENL